VTHLRPRFLRLCLSLVLAAGWLIPFSMRPVSASACALPGGSGLPSWAQETHGAGREVGIGASVVPDTVVADRIWGRIHTTEGRTVEGFIRWGRNDGSWVDLLDGRKETREENYEIWLRAEDRDGPPLRAVELRGYRITWEEDDPDFPKRTSSAIRFGHLRSLRAADGETAELTLRNGERVDLRGGRGTDLGASLGEVLVEVPGEGPARAEVELEWSRIDRVVFSASPPSVRPGARRLYGTLEDVDGRRFQGYVAWDRDEILTSDVLDGEEVGGGAREIPFSRVASIEATSRGSRVRLRSGEEVELTGSNDVDRRNRGIQISDPGLGRVVLEWEGFRRLRLHPPDPAAVDGARYEGFGGGRPLAGTVVTRAGEELEGRLRWDGDEEASWEPLDGETETASFEIEFGRVARIERGEVSGAVVTLVDGRSFELEGSSDVGWDNRGIFVAPGRWDADPPRDSWRVISWDELSEVRFRTEGSGEDGGGEG